MHVWIYFDMNRVIFILIFAEIFEILENSIFYIFPILFFFFFMLSKTKPNKHNHDSKNYYNRGEIQTAKRPGTRLRILGSDANYMCRRSGANEVMVHIINVAMPAPVKCKGLWRRKAR